MVATDDNVCKHFDMLELKQSFVTWGHRSTDDGRQYSSLKTRFGQFSKHTTGYSSVRAAGEAYDRRWLDQLASSAPYHSLSSEMLLKMSTPCFNTGLYSRRRHLQIDSFAVFSLSCAHCSFQFVQAANSEQWRLTRNAVTLQLRIADDRPN